MADDRVAEIINDFFLKTCPLRRRLGLNVDDFVVMSDSTRLVEPRREDDIIPLSTGSVAEFYIKPMLSCVGDVDIMYHLSSELAIPQGHPPPTQLPDEFHGRVRVCEIIDSGFPGYVHLMWSSLLTEITDDGKYRTVPCLRQYLSHPKNEHGPANMLRNFRNQIPSAVKSASVSGSMLSSDAVVCMRCLSWPLQAADWPTRDRNYGWPDSATVDRVVSNGCDVVGVAHRLCRQDEWMSRHQNRLSFSRAEIVLINSWMPMQQIFYHMLRFFMKGEGLTDIRDSTGKQILCNYNIKTLMLWACERMQRSWWNNDLNVVGTCVKLLHILADWLTDARCPHYFVNNCNLFDSLDNSQLTQNTAHGLQSVTQTWLAEWFVNNYIRKCGDVCLDSRVSRLFDDISTHVKLQNAVSAVVVWRLGKTLRDAGANFLLAPLWIHRLLHFPSPSLQKCLHLTREVSKMDERLSVYFTAVIFLHVAFRTNRNQLTGETLDILSTVCLQSNDVRRCLNARHSSVLSRGQAAKLMKVIASNSDSTVQLIEIELSKAYLYRALRCKDSDSDSIYCLANVYLAVLYYTTGQYQKAIDHCTVVTRSHDHSQCSSHVVQGELLPKIDDDIDSVLGLAVFYQYIRTAALNQQQQTQYVSVFSTELLAHYLYIKCQSVVKTRQFTQMSSADEVQRYEKCFDVSSQVFVTDVIVAHLVRRGKYSSNAEKPASSREQTKPVTSGQFDTSELVELLQRSAVEYLTMFRQLEAKELGSLVTSVTTDFEALYAYKHGDYQRCLQLSAQNVHTLIGGGGVSFISTYPEFIQLINDDLVGLIGLMLLVDPECSQDPSNILIFQRSLSLYLMTQCQMKLHHPVTSLAQTLDYIEVARHKLSHNTFEQLLLKLTQHKIMRYVISRQIV